MGNDIDYATLFELGANEQDNADPASGEGTPGEKGQGTADSADQKKDDNTAELPPESGAGQDKKDKPDGKAKASQTPEERAKNAGQRRQKEESDRIRREAEIDAAAEIKAKQIADARISRLGLKNTFTGKPITTQEEHDEFERQRNADAAEKVLKRAGIPKDIIDKLVSEHPDVLAAKQAAEKLKTAELRASEAAGRAKLDEEMSKITKDDPDIQTLDDVKSLQNFDAIYQRVMKQGLSLSEAYYLENREKVDTVKREAAKQAALNSANGKNHLQSDATHGTGSAAVPKQTMEYYRYLNPEMSDAEIAKAYNNYLGKG